MAYFKLAFAPSREEVWATLRAQIGGEVVHDTTWSGEKLRVDVGEWTVTLDEYKPMITAGRSRSTTPHTRIRAPFPNPSGFRFSIHRASVFSYLGTLLGMQDIQVGHPEFDESFVVKSNNEAAVLSLCNNDKLRALVTAQPKFQLSIEDDEGWFGTKYPEGVDVLVFDVVDRIREVERLKELYDVFAETLNQLSEMGLAGSGSGGVTI